MKGVTGLRPFTNDLQDTSPPTSTDSAVDFNKTARRPQLYNEQKLNFNTDAMCNANDKTDEYSDDETVKTAHSSMNNTAITTDTDTAYEHEEDDQHTLPTN